MFNGEKIRKLWSETKPKVLGGNYWMVSFGLQNTELVKSIISRALFDINYHSVIRDHHEIAVIIHESIWKEYRNLNSHSKEYGPLSGITFDVPLDVEVSGYLLPMVQEMAKNNISIIPQCALIFDHIFISATDLESAASIISDINVLALSENEI